MFSEGQIPSRDEKLAKLVPVNSVKAFGQTVVRGDIVQFEVVPAPLLETGNLATKFNKSVVVASKLDHKLVHGKSDRTQEYDAIVQAYDSGIHKKADAVNEDPVTHQLKMW